jgi:serine/threonine protein kinase
MEFVPGRTLEKIIQTAGRLSERDSLALIAQATDGLSCAHRGGIVHRDVKPANMVVTASGVLKITDFGITLIPQLALQGWGTAAYMAPEQLVGDTSDGRTDIYSLAIVLYELLCGSTPFVSGSEYELLRMQVENALPRLTERVGGLSPRIEQAVMRALSKRRTSVFRRWTSSLALWVQPNCERARQRSCGPPTRGMQGRKTNLVGCTRLRRSYRKRQKTRIDIGGHAHPRRQLASGGTASAWRRARSSRIAPTAAVSRWSRIAAGPRRRGEACGADRNMISAATIIGHLSSTLLIGAAYQKRSISVKKSRLSAFSTVKAAQPKKCFQKDQWLVCLRSSANRPPQGIIGVFHRYPSFLIRAAYSLKAEFL